MFKKYVVVCVLVGVRPSVDVSSNPVCLFTLSPPLLLRDPPSSPARCLSAASSLGHTRLHPSREKCLSMGGVRGVVDRASSRLPLVSKD